MWIHKSIVSATTKAALGHLVEHLHLDHRRAVGQKQIAATAIGFGQHRDRTSRTRSDGLRAFRGRSCSADTCRASETSWPPARRASPRCRSPGFPAARMLGRKILAHDAHQPHAGEVAGGVGEIRRPSRPARRRAVRWAFRHYPRQSIRQPASGMADPTVMSERAEQTVEYITPPPRVSPSGGRNTVPCQPGRGERGRFGLAGIHAAAGVPPPPARRASGRVS